MTAVSRRGAIAGVFARRLSRAAAHIPARLRGLEGPAAPSDAALIGLAADHLENFRAYNFAADDRDDRDALDAALWRAYCRTLDGLDLARPNSFAGIVAKARAAKMEDWGPDGWGADGGNAQRWAWDIVNDLLRVSGMELHEADLPQLPPLRGREVS